MNILVIGANGQLGRALMKVLPEATGVDRDKLDVSDKKSLDQFKWGTYPGMVINAAAYTLVDAAETPEGREKAWEVNARGVELLAQKVHELGQVLVHISTDYVFDGTSLVPYLETDQPNPISEYGKSKAAGDKAAAIAHRYIIVRTSWVIGDGPNFVRTMLRLGKEIAEISVVDDQRGRPTFAFDLANAIPQLFENPHFAYGIYNCTNSGPVVSWAEFAREIFSQAKIDCQVKPITTAEYIAGKENIANRPANSALDLTKLEEAGINMPDWRESLTNYLKEELEK